MQLVKRLLLPILLPVLVSLACSSTPTARLRQTETAIAGEIYQSLTANAPALTPPVESIAVPQDTPFPIYTPTPQPKAVVESGMLNLRDGPGIAFAVLDGLKNGEELTISGQYQNCSWLKVERITGDVGWVKAGPGYANFGGECSAIPHGSFRPLNGTVVFDRRPVAGLGSLTVDNGTPIDGLVVLVNADSLPVVAFYLRSMQQFTLKGFPDGIYYIYFQNGEGWDGDEMHFTLIDTAKRVNQPIEFVTTYEGYTTWTLTLASYGAGSVAASDIPPDTFPTLK